MSPSFTMPGSTNGLLLRISARYLRLPSGSSLETQSSRVGNIRVVFSSKKIALTCPGRSSHSGSTGSGKPGASSISSDFAAGSSFVTLPCEWPSG